MPKLSRKELTTWVDQQRERFKPLIGKGTTIVFGKHSFEDKLQDVKLARQADMTNKPDMRIDENGTAYTPPVIEFTFTGGQLFFVIEDLSLYTTLSGIALDMSDYKVIMREAYNEDH